MLTIYHLDNSRSERVVWLAEELGIPYDQVTHLREKGMAPLSFRDIHPLGRAPVVRLGDQVMMESGAICDFLVHLYGEGQLSPERSSYDYPRYLEWMHFAEGSCMSGLLVELVGGMVANDPDDNEQISAITKRNRAMLRYIDDELSTRPYFAGEHFSAADIMMEFNFSFLERYCDKDCAEYSNIRRWLEQVRGRAAYARAMEMAAPQQQQKS